jgi:hypothetical protein
VDGKLKLPLSRFPNNAGGIENSKSKNEKAKPRIERT